MMTNTALIYKLYFHIRNPNFQTPACPDPQKIRKQESMMGKAKQIAVIGAGISGLLACKYAMEKGFEPMVFDSRSDVGGVWTQTIASTKLQTPKYYYQFSDFAWPSSVVETFPDHNQVMDYLRSYAVRFHVIPRIRFNTKVVSIQYVAAADDDEDAAAAVSGWELWGGNGEAFSPTGKWNVVVEDVHDPSTDTKQVYQVDFVILCIGKFSDLPYIPDFPLNRGPEVFDGKVIHSMDYSAMDDDSAAEFIRNKRVTVIGFQKSAVDLASEVSSKNGVNYPCTLVFKRAHWGVPEFVLELTFRNLNRFAELMIHKPHEKSFLLWLLAFLLSPLLWIFELLVETCLKWMYPLKKYKMVPDHSFLQQIYACMLMVLPPKFYHRVEEGSLILKKSQTFSFCKNGLIVNNDTKVLESDIVIFATGFRSDDKLKNIFTSTNFQKCITGSSVPFYRECIHPRIPQLAILGYSESAANLFTTEMKARWLAHFLAGKFTLPPVKAMEEDAIAWEKCMRHHVGERYTRACASALLQIHSNDQLCKDLGVNPRRKSWFLSEIFAPYGPADYRHLS